MSNLGIDKILVKTSHYPGKIKIHFFFTQYSIQITDFTFFTQYIIFGVTTSLITIKQSERVHGSTANFHYK